MGEVLWLKESVVARKRYACYWCGEAIDPGDHYARWVWADAGGISTVRVHPECRAAWWEEASAEGGYLEVGFAEGERPRGDRNQVRTQQATGGLSSGNNSG